MKLSLDDDYLVVRWGRGRRLLFRWWRGWGFIWWGRGWWRARVCFRGSVSALLLRLLILQLLKVLEVLLIPVILLFLHTHTPLVYLHHSVCAQIQLSVYLSTPSPPACPSVSVHLPARPSPSACPSVYSSVPSGSLSVYPSLQPASLSIWPIHPISLSTCLSSSLSVQSMHLRSGRSDLISWMTLIWHMIYLSEESYRSLH